MPTLRHPLTLIERFWMQSLASELLPLERVSKCLREIAPLCTHVHIAKNRITHKAHYRNLIVCARVWQCPICANVITDNRRKELTKALATSDLFPVLITYTLAHKKGDPLPEMLAALLDTFRALKSGKRWQNFTGEYGWIGSIRSLEVTYGDNGWHVHIHELALLDRANTAASEQGMVRFIRERWLALLRKAGKSASWDRGVDLRSKRKDIADYVAKYGHEPIATGWTVEHELTRAPAKRGRVNGRTPMQLLCDYGQGDPEAGRLFVEYSAAFKGRNQLVWSRGLRERLGIEEVISDEEIMRQNAADGETVLELDRAQWNKVVKSNKRGHLLELASKPDLDEMYSFVAEILSEDTIGT